MPTGASSSAQSSNVFTLHARHEHGGHPVRVSEPGSKSPRFEVEWPDGPVAYESARKLFMALYNEGDVSPAARDPGMTFNRYFRLAKAEPELALTVFDLFAPEVEQPAGVYHPAPKRLVTSARRCPPSAGRWYRRPIVAAATTLALFGSPDLANAKSVVVEPALYRWADQRPTPGQLAIPSTESSTSEFRLSVAPRNPLGIDLGVRGHEVRKLMFKIFGGRITRRGFDPEDVLQEIHKGLLARNRGKCPFDVTKSSFGHYVCMVIRCVLSNYERKMSRRFEHEQVGMYSAQAGENGGLVDAALVAATVGGPMTSGSLSVEEMAGTSRAFGSLLLVINTTGRNENGDIRPEAVLAAKCLPYVYQGYQRAEIARKLGEDPGRVGRALSFLRKSAATWKLETGIS